MTTPLLRIGTRRSKLALWQAEWVAGQLRALGASVELVEITTSGDVQQAEPVPTIGLQGVFTKEVQSAVLQGKVDVAIHSLKDLPTEVVDGLTLAAVPERETVADALVTDQAASLAEMPAGARVGTGSQRRRAQILHLRPDLNVVAIRGNVDSRLRKLDEGQCDAVILAAAGLRRLGVESRITEVLEPPRMLPSPGQGALAVECRTDDSHVLDILQQLDHSDSYRSTSAERSLLSQLHGGCSVPVAAWGRLEGGELLLDGLVASLDGLQVLRASSRSAPDEPNSLGQQVANQLLDQGAAEIIAAARK